MVRPDRIDSIRQRLALAGEMPEAFVDRRDSAAIRWREDVTTLLAEIDRLRKFEEAALAMVEMGDE